MMNDELQASTAQQGINHANTEQQTTKSTIQQQKQQQQQQTTPLLQNPFFQTGASLLLLTFSLQTIKQSTVQLSALLQKTITTKLEISSTDRAHQWMLNWAQKQYKLQNRRMRNMALNTTIIQPENGNIRADFQFQQGVGRHILKHANTWILVKRPSRHACDCSKIIRQSR